MTDEVRLLFHEVADLPKAERDRLFAARGIAPEVCAEIESLLLFDELADGSLTLRVSRAAAQVAGSGEIAAIGMCGPYRLLRALGSGGMGRVYLAERTDGEVRQKAAIKLLRSDRERPSWRERFLRERQLLADLNHPSVARLLDAGHTADGRPYLAMEYVEGTPIDVFASGKTLKNQLELFLRVCEGVAHAHRHLIIHRDLKPSNILVDSTGQPKLLDFGIAKLLDETTDPTQTVERMSTPNYASPEQLVGASQTTLTDVYSLGAVLYKLVTGKSPHESEKRTSRALEIAAGKLEIPAPSRLKPGLPADFDCILRKALRKEAGERYTSVDAFANDIRAFLESRPVLARSGDRWYRVRKLLRRHWMPLAAAMVAVIGLSAGLWLADRQRAIAQRRFEDVRQLANRLFDIDTEARQVPGNTATRQMIVNTSLEYLRRLAADVRGDPELALEVGNAYMRVARVQGVPIGINLGQLPEAEQSLRMAEKSVQAVLAAQPGNRTAFLRMAQIAHDRMLVARLETRREQALSLARVSEEWLEKFHAGKGDLAESKAMLAVYMNVADEYYNNEQFDDALRLSRRATEVALTLEAKPLENQPYIGMFKWVSAEVYQELGNLQQAREQIRQSVKMLEPAPENHDQARLGNYILVLVWQGRILGQEDAPSLGRREEALESFDRGFQLADALAHKDSRDQNSRGRLEMAAMNMADLLCTSDPGRALDLYDHALRHMAEIPQNAGFRRSEVRLLAHSTRALRRLERRAEAKQRLDAAFARLRELKLYPVNSVKLDSPAAEAVRALADYEAWNGSLTRALEIYDRLLDQIQASKPQPETRLTDAVQLSNLYAAAAGVYRRAGRDDLVSALESRRLDLWRSWDRKLPQNPFVLRQLDQ